jgi:hypothetical protein
MSITSSPELTALLDALPTTDQITNLISGLDLLDEITTATTMLNEDGTPNPERTKRFNDLGISRSAQEGLARLRDALEAYKATFPTKD